MPALSQRTLARVIVALDEMLPDSADTFPLMRNFWRTTLFGSGFPNWLIQFVLKRSWNWSVIIPELFAGRVETADYDNVVVPELLCHQMLRNLTVLAFSESKTRTTQEGLRLSLQLDGFDISGENFRPIDGPVSVEEEKSRLLHYLKASKLGRYDVISKHIRDAEDLFNEGKHHAAIGEARSALQAVMEEVVSLVESNEGKKSGGGTRNQIEFLEEKSILSTDEQAAFLAAWGFLSSGNHPGLSSEEEGRIGIILCLEFIQILLVKCKNLL